jgi:UDP-galactopyranose mutase
MQSIFQHDAFYQMCGVKTPEEAKAKIDEQKAESDVENPKNL